MYSVYILKSGKDGNLYIGQTHNVELRIKMHNAGRVKATRNRRPMTLLIHKDYQTRAEAMKMEKYLKNLKGGNEFQKIMTHWGFAKW